MQIVATNQNPRAFRPYCQRCGWRKGGPDSWDGNGCKCTADRYAEPIRNVDSGELFICEYPDQTQ